MKIYIQETPLYLCKDPSTLGIDLDAKDVLVSHYTGKIKNLLNHIDLLEKSSKKQAVVLVYKNIDVLIGDFRSLYKILPAAGALVTDEQGHYLMIHRLGHWDLPKGKIEKGESIETAAVREIEEETGAQHVALQQALLTTYHTYKIKKKRLLKQTYWFSATAPRQELLAQAEENIEKAVWVDYEQFDRGEDPIYSNILDVISSYRHSIK